MPLIMVVVLYIVDIKSMQKTRKHKFSKKILRTIVPHMSITSFIRHFMKNVWPYFSKEKISSKIAAPNDS
jgi:hypothetical protein